MSEEDILSGIEGMLYKRQFVLSKTHPLSDGRWSRNDFDDFFIYTHADDKCVVLDARPDGLMVGMVGYMLDPYNPESSDEDILAEIARQPDIKGVTDTLKKISGRFALFVKKGGDVLVFHDPCGLKSVYYTTSEGSVFVGSGPAILSEFTCVEKTDDYYDFLKTKYHQEDKESWLPSGMSLFKNVKHLVPNHYLDTKTLSQHRYYPDSKLVENADMNIAPTAAELIRSLMAAARKRYPLALPVTSGWDSRLLFCASRDFASENFYYTLRYRGMNSHSPDIKIPSQMLSKLGLEHRVIDSHGEAPAEFIEFYERNAAVSHYNDWGKMAYAMMSTYPHERLCIKGNGSGIIKCHYYKKNLTRKIATHEDILKVIYNWKGLSYAEAAIKDWYSATAPVAEAFNFHILDLLYWEHRMGSWQSQSQLEWGFLQETFTPFNHRPLFEVLMSAPVSYRLPPECQVFRDMCHYLRDDVMEFPVNPLSIKARVNNNAKKLLSRVGAYESIRNLRNLVLAGR